MLYPFDPQADLHVHTLHSYDVIPNRPVDPLSLYLRARELGRPDSEGKNGAAGFVPLAFPKGN